MTETIKTASALAVGIIALVDIAVFAVLIYRLALVEAQKRAMGVQSDVITSYEQRIGQLEAQVEELIKKQDADGKTISRLEGVIDGKTEAIKEFIDAVAETDRCLHARAGCLNRQIPTV